MTIDIRISRIIVLKFVEFQDLIYVPTEINQTYVASFLYLNILALFHLAFYLSSIDLAAKSTRPTAVKYISYFRYPMLSTRLFYHLLEEPLGNRQLYHG